MYDDLCHVIRVHLKVVAGGCALEFKECQVLFAFGSRVIAFESATDVSERKLMGCMEAGVSARTVSYSGGHAV